MPSAEYTYPEWFGELLGRSLPAEGECIQLHGTSYRMIKGKLRAETVYSDRQKQTEDTFGFKWQKRDTFESAPFRSRHREWLNQRYGKATEHPFLAQSALVLDAGCGAGWSALEYFSDVLPQIRYLGVDISEAVDVAAGRFEEHGFEGAFIQSDLQHLPIPKGSVDVIFSEGVLHHTDSTEEALKSLVPFLKPGGRFMFYVYRRKGAIREFTDDYIRERLQHMSGEEAWQALMPLTKLGKALGELKVTVDVPEAIELLGIPAGTIDLQRLFYWHVCKAFYDPNLSLEEMNHINFDWFSPANAHRQTPEDVRQWCREAGLAVEREVIEEAGITIIAQKQDKTDVAESERY